MTSIRKPCPRRTRTAAIPLADLTAVGVTTVAIPRTDKPSTARPRIGAAVGLDEAVVSTEG